MGALEKLKLLFKYRKPLGEIAKVVGEAKKGWKTVAFWVTLVGSLGSTAAALGGVIPVEAQLVVTSVLTALYNILRGLQKAETPEIKGTLRTSEFWLTVAGELQKGIVVVEQGGINPEWLGVTSAVVGGFLAAGQSLAARNVKAEAPVAPAKP